jgi:type IV pilus assembly protein PilO
MVKNAPWLGFHSNRGKRKLFFGFMGLKLGAVFAQQRRILGAFGIFLLTGFLALWFTLLGPLNERKISASTEMESLSDELERLKGVREDILKMRSQADQLRVKMERARRELPDRREIPGLLSAISERAKDAGLEVRLFQTREEVLGEFYAEVPVQLVVQGSFHEVAGFFDEVTRLDRIVTVSELSMKSAESAGISQRKSGMPNEKMDGSSSKLDQQTVTGCTLTTFRQLSEGEFKEAATTDSVTRKKRF